MGRNDEPDNPERQLAKEAIAQYGPSAAAVLSRQADMLFSQEDIKGAFYLRLVVAEIELLQGSKPSSH